MTNTHIPSRTHVKNSPGAVIYTDIEVMDRPSIGRARYFVTVIDEVYGHVTAFRMTSRSKAAKLLKCLASQATVCMYGREKCFGWRKRICQGLEGC